MFCSEAAICLVQLLRYQCKLKITISLLLDLPCTFSAHYSQESPDENPVLDRHPVYSNIVFGAGFSGRSEETVAIFCTCTSVSLLLHNNYKACIVRKR